MFNYNKTMTAELNIIELIESNPIIKLSDTYNIKLLTKIKSVFLDQEQQLFVSSFYCYLNYNKTDFIVELLLSPTATWIVPVVPATGTGVVRGVVVPSPSCPFRLLPQHLTVPSVRTAHVAPLPATIATAPVSPLTATGVAPDAPVPSPS